MHYVDLGCKHGGAIDVARKHGHVHGIPRNPKPGLCIGVDRSPDYAASMRKRGYQFFQGKLPDCDFPWPDADCYLAWNFLEHLDSIEIAKEVLGDMIRHSTHGVWLLMPTFEDDVCKALAARGFELPWYNMKGHRALVLKRHVLQVVASMPGKVKRVVWKPKWPISNLQIKDLKVLPDMKPKPGPIRPSLVGAWECFLHTR